MEIKSNKSKPIKSKKQRNKKRNIESESQFKYVLFFAVGLLLFFMVLIKGDGLWKFSHDFVFGMFGFLSFFLGISIMCISILYSYKTNRKAIKFKIYSFAALFIFFCTQIQIHLVGNISDFNFVQSIANAWKNGADFSAGGGVVGEIFSLILRRILGHTAAIIFSWIVIFVLFLRITGITLFSFFKTLFKPVKRVENSFKNFKINSRFNIDVPLKEEDESLNDESDEKKAEYQEPLDVSDNLNFFRKNKIEEEENIVKNYNKDFEKNIPKDEFKEDVSGLKEQNLKEDLNGYCYPSDGLLNEPKHANNLDISAELKSNALRLVDTLKSFGVETRITDICRGPAVTRYELQPSAGVKISKITNLADDISLNLASEGVRIEAPVPNKAAVGIEVPNKEKEVVYLKEVISSNEFKSAKSRLTFALGKDIAGNVKVADIAKMPHILIAGATGSGKSVCVNSLIVSLLYKSSPSEVRFLMIDPKVVELLVYNGVPHLLVPVVTDPKKASGALSWAVSEMMKRYKLFAETGVREMKSYNVLAESGKKNKEGQPYEKMPQIVIIIDELADLMMASLSKEVENSICRLAQMARAAGMHLVIATQRPSVDVITGLIKANIPSRIAFTVSSQVDSRTILDMTGAEKLLGKGDMLYYPTDEQKPIRVQGCFLTEKEIENVVNFVKQDKSLNYDEDVIEEIDRHSIKADKKSAGSNGNLQEFDEKDPMIFSAIETVVEFGQASTSFLQRKLKLGYSRAARIMDELEDMKIVGPQVGSKPREILITKEDFLQMSLNKDK